MILLWKIIALINVLSTIVSSQFESQYLGNSITFDQYNHLEIGCQTTLCLLDAQRLLLAATQNKTIFPCDNFQEFSMGEFIRLRAINERYESVGFDNDVQLLHWERNRKVLAAKIKPDDIKPFKIAKNMYQNCVNSNNVRENGTLEILQYLKSLGGSPLINSSWNGEDFDTQELLENEFHSVGFFLLQRVGRCLHPYNSSKTIICLSSIEPLVFSDEQFIYIFKMFKVLGFDINLLKSALKLYKFYIAEMLNYKISTPSFPRGYTVSSINNFTNSNFNWVKIINARLTTESAVTEDTQILIQNPNLISTLIKLIETTPKETLANIFAINQLFHYKSLFVVYAFDEIEENEQHTLKSKQRWEQCVEFATTYFGPALYSLYALKYFNSKVQESARNITKEVVEDYIRNINDSIEFNYEAKQDIISKLNSTEYIIGYPDEVFDLKKIELFYDGLELNGTEPLVETYQKLELYDLKIRKNPSTNWKKKLHDQCTTQYFIEYFIDDNILYVPPMFLHFPYFHPNRSRFFNTATIFYTAAHGLHEGIGEYLFKKWNERLPIHPLILTYNNYLNWEKQGGKELQLPGFFLTNHQMFWLVTAHLTYSKNHKNHSIEGNELGKEFFNILLKTITGFREDFKCSEISEDEEKIELSLKLDSEKK